MKKKLVILTALFVTTAGYASEYIDSEKPNCKVFNSNPIPHETITWSGGCENGYATGEGVLNWYQYGKLNSTYTGNIRQGKYHGKGKDVSAKSPYRFEGTYTDGKAVEGKLITSAGVKLEGYFKNGSLDGFGIRTEDDNVQKGIFKKGKLFEKCPSEQACNAMRQYIPNTRETPKVPVTDRFGRSCLAGFPFTNIPNGLKGKMYGYTARYSSGQVVEEGTCKDDGKKVQGLGDSIVEFYTPDGNLYAVYWGDEPKYVDERIKPKYNKLSEVFGVCKRWNCWWFADGEVWDRTDGNWTNTRTMARRRGTDEYEANKVKMASEEKKRRDAKAAADAKVFEARTKEFRRNLAPGDVSREGMVIEIKGSLVKIQVDERQCTQRKTNGNCINWMSTPVEKWVKKETLFPN